MGDEPVNIIKLVASKENSKSGMFKSQGTNKYGPERRERAPITPPPGWTV